MHIKPSKFYIHQRPPNSFTTSINRNEFDENLYKDFGCVGLPDDIEESPSSDVTAIYPPNQI
jgi:hypothetical protein